jgi:hypothetical protein
MRIIVNGKSVIIPDDETSVGKARQQLAKEIGRDLLVLEDGNAGTRVLGEQESLQEGMKIWSVPKIVKGGSRLEEETELLKSATGTRSNVRVGAKTIGNRVYTAIRVTNVRLSGLKFGVTRTDLLFLLPPEYPTLPPIGCYLNYRWPTADHHFTLQAYYGAPVLGEDGWYWYCVGLGGGFNMTEWTQGWRPGNRADNGHNLATLFVAARHALNED